MNNRQISRRAPGMGAASTGTWLALFALLAGMAVATPAAAQLNAENFAQLGFNFSPPGARSAAMGGAFIPLADDATAAETNPAGLTQLLYPQLSFEYKALEYTRTLEEPVADGTSSSEFANQVALPSFASLAYPFSDGDAVIGFFGHQLVDYRSTVASAGVDFGSGLFLRPYTSDIDMSVQNVGGALAFRLGSLMSLGVAGGASQLDMTVDFPRYDVPIFEPGYLANRLVVDGSGSGSFANAGVLLKFGSVLQIGGVYKLRPSFSGMEYRLEDAEGELLPASSAYNNQGEFTVKVPDSWGGGVAVRPYELFTLSASAVVNRYSQLADNTETVFLESIDPDETLNSEDYVANDAVDIHAGAELILFLGTTPLAVRGGAAMIAASNTFYVGPDPIERLLWGTEPNESTLQFSAGLGTVLFGRLQLEAAGVMGEQRSEVVASIVYFFEQL
ncbi:MAG TPA: outer membrane protein transport protein [Longimicrobiales bacterium]|nr:outer membrane protein transport protein [Longimicrobiales bacterium]